jgi:hypothetical protein
MQIDNFKFYIRVYNIALSAYVYYYEDANGDIQTTTTKTAINFAPKGWKEMQLKWERGYTYYGVFTNYTNPFEFAQDGATILRFIYYNDGIEAKTELLIEKHTLVVATWGYAEYYKGDIDFSRFNDKKNYVVIECMEGGFMAELNAKESTEFEIPVDTNANVVWVRMDGINLQAKADYTGIVQPTFNVGKQQASGISIPFLDHIDTLGFSNGDIFPKGTGDNFANFSQFYDQLNFGFITNQMQEQYFISNKSDTLAYDVNIKGSIWIDSTNNSSQNRYLRVWIYRYNMGSSTILATTLVGISLVIAPSATLAATNDFDTTITLQPNDALILLFNYIGDPGWSVPIDVDARILNLDLTATWLNKYKETYIPAIRPNTLGQEITDKITTGYTFNSDQATTYDNYVLTSGDALRNLTNSVIKTTFEDMFKAYDCMWNTAFRTNGVDKIFIDTKASVFDTITTPYQLGEVATLEVMPLTSEMFAKLDIGYNPQNYDEINGKEEFNTKYQFQSALNRVKNAKNLVSPYRADMYGIELTRANLDGKKEADNETDNDVFWIDIEDTSAGTVPAGYPGAGQPYYDLYRDNPSYIQAGLISPTTAFNLRLSPKRRMNEHGNVIKSVLYPELTQTLTFTSSAKTTDGGIGLEWDNGSVVYNEKDSEVVNDLDGTPLFYPLIFKIKVKIPQNILSGLNTNPYRRMSFIYKGLTLYGFLIEMSDKPAFAQEQEYRLLCSTDNTLTDLIYI